MEDDSVLEEEGEFSLPRYSQPVGYVDFNTTEQVSMDTHIPETNIGYKLLQKLGWKAGKGLGVEGQGRVDPIRIDMKDDSLGVGKAEEYMSNHVSSTAKRKALDSEKQLEETEVQKEERRYKVSKKLEIEKELEQVKRAFYCELCDKQYNKISEYEQHLQSYDHHHKKRFKDMKDSARNSSMHQSEKERIRLKEKKREERELKRMQMAIQQRMGNSDASLAHKSTPTPITPPVNDSKSSGGWTTVNDTKSSGGWSTVNDSKSSGGISTVNDTKSSGGWTTANDSKSSGGWTTINDAKSSSGISSMQNSITDYTPAVNKVSIDRSKEIVSPSVNTSTKPTPKLTFGLKKSSSFQFGLKKKQ